jgi:hypothetical protein
MDELFSQPNADRLIEELLNVNSQLSFVLGLYEDAANKGVRPNVNPLNVSGFVPEPSAHDSVPAPTEKREKKSLKNSDKRDKQDSATAINITLPGKKADKDKGKNKSKRDKPVTPVNPGSANRVDDVLISFDQPVNPVTPVNTYNPFVPLVQAPPPTTGHVLGAQPVPTFSSTDDDFAFLAKRQRPPSQQFTTGVNVTGVNPPPPTAPTTYNPFVPLVQPAPVDPVPATVPYNPFVSSPPTANTQKKPKFDSIDDMLKDL